MQKEQFKKYIQHILDYHKELDKWCETLGSDLFTCPIFMQTGYIIDGLIDCIGHNNDD